MYRPDNWVVIKITDKENVTYKLLVGWLGSYTTGDSWRINSGITKFEDAGSYYVAHGHSGSSYALIKGRYGLQNNNVHIYEQLCNKFPNQIELLDENTNWCEKFCPNIGDFNITNKILSTWDGKR